jgi:SAM-dependent methyltransferase
MPSPARHPERLATIGTLLGIDVAPIARCRVLELACGDGANLVPIAAALPGATFVGLDHAARPIARARRMADELGLANVRLLERDIRDIPDDLGTFDYVIAHGLYSWVAADVRAHVMPVIKRHLAPAGIAFVSYNALPGSHMRRAVWDMLGHHTRGIGSKPAQVAAARALLELVAMPVDGENARQQALRAEIRAAATSSDASLAHDDLSEANDPVYFHAFAADAARAGLTFAAEAHLGTMVGRGIAPNVRTMLGRLDRLAREQYLDFIEFRHFRESLLCHDGTLSTFVVQPSRASGLHAVPSLNARRIAANDRSAFDADGAAAAIIAALLERWPQSVPVAELALTTVFGADRKPARPLEAIVTDLFASDLVDLRTAPVAVAATAGARPEAFAAARWINRDHDVIPTLYHEALRYADPLGRRLLSLLDGTRSRDELAAALGGAFIGPSGRARLDGVLDVLAAKALLVR